MLSRSTRTVINQNFLFGMVFIVVGLSLAAFGIVGPIIAAIMHNAGSLIVVFNSARLVRKGEELEHFQPQDEAASTQTSGTTSETSAAEVTVKPA